MQHLQHGLLHANRKRGFCYVQWSVDNERQKDYQC